MIKYILLFVIVTAGMVCTAQTDADGLMACELCLLDNKIKKRQDSVARIPYYGEGYKSGGKNAEKHTQEKAAFYRTQNQLKEERTVLLKELNAIYNLSDNDSLMHDEIAKACLYSYYNADSPTVEIRDSLNELYFGLIEWELGFMLYQGYDEALADMKPVFDSLGNPVVLWKTGKRKELSTIEAELYKTWYSEYSSTQSIDEWKTAHAAEKQMWVDSLNCIFALFSGQPENELKQMTYPVVHLKMSIYSNYKRHRILTELERKIREEGDVQSYYAYSDMVFEYVDGFKKMLELVKVLVVDHDRYRLVSEYLQFYLLEEKRLEENQYVELSPEEKEHFENLFKKGAKAGNQDCIKALENLEKTGNPF